jgi:predicted pyridoxine 5'-phosphate oxidase superfamily flavin-nucleotide-binding protein
MLKPAGSLFQKEQRRLRLMCKMEISEDIKRMVENNVVALTSVNKNNTPRNIAVAYVKVKDNKIVITANYMNTTLKNIRNNPNVSMVVWDNNGKGYRIDGITDYFDSGEWYEFVKSMKENKNEPCKGALVVDVREVKNLN